MSRNLVLRALIIFAIGSAMRIVGFGILHMTSRRVAEVSQSGMSAELVAEPGTVPLGGPFTLTDYTGKTVTDSDFRGKYLLVFFGFTYCPDVCPTTLREIAIALALDQLGSKADGVRVLFISADPERDRPDSMAEYVSAFQPNIVGLTGSNEQIAAVSKECSVYYDKINVLGAQGSEARRGSSDAGKSKPLQGDYTISHQGNTYLMSPEGDYLTHFTYDTEPQEMAAIIRKAISKFGYPNS